MSRVAMSPVWAGRLLALACAAVIVGCDEASEPVDPAPVATRTAEERFESIVTALRRQVEDASLSSGTGAGAPPGTPVASGRVRVESELGPVADGETRRATISLITKSKVTVLLPRSSSGDEESSDGLGETADALKGVSGLPDLESLRVPGAAGGDSGELSGGGALHEIQNDESRRVYDLEYRDGKWVMLTEPDEENEPFYALALEYALKKQ